MRFYNDERRKERLSDLYEMSYRNGERNNVGVQILHGLQRAKDNIRTIREMRQQKILEDQKFDIAKRENQLALEKAELELGPDAVAGRKEELNLLRKKQKIDSLLKDRALQRAQISEEERFASGVNFVRKINQQIKDSGDESLFGMRAGIDKEGNYVLSPTKQDDETKLRAEAFKAAKDEQGEVTEERFNSALNMLRGGASSVPEASALPNDRPMKHGTRAKNQKGEIIQYDAKSRRWARVN